MPRAIIGGVSLVIVVYLLVNVSYMTVLGPAGVLESEAVAVVRIQTGRQADKQTSGQVDRQTGKQADRQTGRQVDLM